VIRRAAVSLPLAIVALDVAVVGVLLPDIRLDLGSSPSGGQWVMNAYLLAAAAVVLAPRRAPLAAGAVAMAAGSVICATAGSTAALVAGRAVQGAGTGALLAGAALPQLALPGLALALGPLLGGVLAQENWWHLYFWAGLPLTAAAAVGAALSEPHRDERPDWLMHAAVLVVAVVVLVQAEPWGLNWPALALAAAALGVALRRAPGAAFAWATLAGCLTALLFLMPEYFQLVRNLSGSRSGVLLLALTLPAVSVPVVAQRLPWRMPALGPAGAVCSAAGLALLATIEPHSRYALLIVALGLVGTGLGAAGHGLRQHGLRRASLEPLLAGAALGLAVAGAGFQLEQADQRDSGATFQEALAAGVSWAAVLLLAVLAAASFAVWQERRTRDGATRASSEARPAAES
jgi:MFS transporter, DHA2 family, methylenomycin A resistance protein